MYQGGGGSKLVSPSLNSSFPTTQSPLTFAGNNTDPCVDEGLSGSAGKTRLVSLKYTRAPSVSHSSMELRFRFRWSDGEAKFSAGGPVCLLALSDCITRTHTHTHTYRYAVYILAGFSFIMALIWFVSSPKMSLIHCLNDL